MSAVRRLVLPAVVLLLGCCCGHAAAAAGGMPKPLGPDVRIAHGPAARGWTWALSAQPTGLGGVAGMCLHGSITPPEFPVSTGTGCFFGSLAKTEKIAPMEFSQGSGDDGQLVVVGAVIPSAARVAISFRDHATVRIKTRRAPRALHTSLRFFAAPVERIATVAHAVAYDRHGRRVARG